MYDVLGLWGDDVHDRGTRGWAIAAGMPTSGAKLVGKWNAKVDHYYNPFTISEGTWEWHFDRSGDGKDSRRKNADEYFKGAQDSCNWRSYMQDDALSAGIALGMSLHPLQDWVAHGDFNRWQEAPRLSGWRGTEVFRYGHNWDSSVALSTKQPDNPGLDAFSADGRPTKDAMFFRTPLSNGDQPLWAAFRPGSARINLVAEITRAKLWEFMDFVRENSDPCGKCRKLFLP